MISLPPTPTLAKDNMRLNDDDICFVLGNTNDTNTIKKVSGICKDLRRISSNSVAVFFEIPVKSNMILFLINRRDNAIRIIKVI